MHLTINHKKYSLRFVLSVFWIAILLFYWDTSFLIFKHYYGLFFNQDMPTIIGVLNLILWLPCFVAPGIMLPAFLYSFMSAIFPQSRSSLLIQPIYITLLKAIARSTYWLFVTLFIFSVAIAFFPEYTQSILNNFISFSSTPSILTNFNFSDAPISKIYAIVTVIPLSLAIVAPSIVSQLMTFCSEFPIISAGLIILSILKAFWQRFKVIEYYRTALTDDKSEPVQLSTEEYQELIEAFGSEKNFKKVINQIKTLKKRCCCK
jgi:hypothetical protein